jgi:hypothetical protein
MGDQRENHPERIFTREYTKYTAGFTFCFVVVVVVVVAAVGMEPLIKIGTISTNI